MTIQDNEDLDLRKKIDVLVKDIAARQGASVGYKYALDGDPSFALSLISIIYWKLDRRERLTNLDRSFLLNILYRISVSATALNVVAGVSEKRGRKTNGVKGLQIAGHVRSAILSGLTVEKAWEHTAESNHLSISMVKRHWSKWKDTELEFREKGTKALATGIKQLKAELGDGDS